MDPAAPCPCGSATPFGECCQPLLVGTRRAATAVQLMRSRYCAFCTHHVDYLLATHHPDYRQADDGDILQQQFKLHRWVHLDILRTRAGGTRDRRGEVEFVAWHLPNGAAATIPPSQMHERSRFVKHRDQWLYTDGDGLAPLPRLQPATDRNAPCWCGSGHKFKRCHGAPGTFPATEI